MIVHLAHRNACAVPARVEHLARRQLAKYTFMRWPDRKILYSGLWGAARHFNYMGEGFLSLAIARIFGHFANLGRETTLSLSSRYSPGVNVKTRRNARRNTARRSGHSISHG